LSPATTPTVEPCHAARNCYTAALHTGNDRASKSLIFLDRSRQATKNKLVDVERN